MPRAARQHGAAWHPNRKKQFLIAQHSWVEGRASAALMAGSRLIAGCLLPFPGQEIEREADFLGRDFRPSR